MIKDERQLDPIEMIVIDYCYPPALAKACCDYFENAMKLKTGEVIFYSKAKPISKEWVFIDCIDDAGLCMSDRSSGLPETSFDRGINIRVSEIVWCADAPNGS